MTLTSFTDNTYICICELCKLTVNTKSTAKDKSMISVYKTNTDILCSFMAQQICSCTRLSDSVESGDTFDLKTFTVSRCMHLHSVCHMTTTTYWCILKVCTRFMMKTIKGSNSPEPVWAKDCMICSFTDPKGILPELNVIRIIKISY